MAPDGNITQSVPTHETFFRRIVPDEPAAWRGQPRQPPQLLRETVLPGYIVKRATTLTNTIVDYMTIPSDGTYDCGWTTDITCAAVITDYATAMLHCLQHVKEFSSPIMKFSVIQRYP